ncbi:hypothetical protein K435DRAFT_877168 [Dendrothele bispora CBS 962.96]|uniref:Prohibitin n=1 Tax=Dendrothele bispora (strain CBS 962.96) TaxID=1314807 RepID=A0A4S8KRI2_DENBC|nr:hypothetical protein K435DRAFT_877168 [Dendrothele bispora CBS 962.96]
MAIASLVPLPIAGLVYQSFGLENYRDVHWKYAFARRCYESYSILGASTESLGKGTTNIRSMDASKVQFIVEKAEQEKKAAIIRAEGEAEAAKTISHALEKAGEAYVAFRKIEASKAIATSLSNNPNVTYIPSGGGNVLLNVPTNK